MTELLNIIAADILMGDELGEGETVCEINGFTNESIRTMGEPDWSKVASLDIRVLVRPQRIVWKDDRGIGPYQDYDIHEGGMWHTFERDAPVRVLRGRYSMPLERWRPF